MRTLRMRNAIYAVIGVALAIAITAAMDAHGLTAFSALPLLPLALIFWALQRLSRIRVGLTAGRLRDYVIALLYPAVVLMVCALIAYAAGATHSSPLNLSHVAIAAVLGILIALLTEEGFFRGWLWASLESARVKPLHILIATSAVFALWHISYATMAQGYILPPAQVVIFIINAAVIGAIWGMMRMLSGSIVVTAVSHSVWNALAYALFGEGPKTGHLGITQTATFGAEVGVVGFLLNCLFAIALYLFLGAQKRKIAPAKNI